MCITDILDLLQVTFADFVLIGCQDLALLPVAKYSSMTNASGKREVGSLDDEDNYSCSVNGTKKRTWEATRTSLKSKKVKGTQSNDCELGSHCSVWTGDERIVNNLDSNCLLTRGNQILQKYELNEGCRARSIRNEDYGGAEISCTTQRCRVMLMNIADDVKKLLLAKVLLV